MKKITCLIFLFFVIMSTVFPFYAKSTSLREDMPTTWNEFKDIYLSNHDDFPFADFNRLNEIGEICNVYRPKNIDDPSEDYVSIRLRNQETWLSMYQISIYLLNEELTDRHPAWIYFYTEGRSHSYMDQFDYTETSEVIPPRNEEFTPQFISYCAPEDFIAEHGAVYKYQKEGVDIYLDQYSNCYFKIENYFFRLDICNNGYRRIDNLLFKLENDHWRFVTEEEYIALQPNFEHNMSEYELGYIWNDKSELVSLLKEIVAGIPAAPDESSQPDESSDATSDTVSNETTEPTVSDEPNESVSENSEISAVAPEGSENTVLIVIIGVATVALVVAAAVIITKKKK